VEIASGVARANSSQASGKEAFVTAGTRTSVTLDVDAKRVLVDSINGWVEEVGAGGLPAGVWQLRSALADDLADN